MDAKTTNLEKLPNEITFVPIPEEQLYAEQSVVCRCNDQNCNHETPIAIISDGFNGNKPPCDHKYHHCEKVPRKWDHKHKKHHKHHKHHRNKFHEHEKHHDVDGKGPKKFQGRAPNEELDPNGPRDKYNIVRIMFFVLGIIHILPFTFFTQANEYWMYKFRNVTSNSTDANDRTYLQANFSSLTHLISSGPSTVTQFLLTFFGHKIRAKTRTVITLLLHSMIFLLQTALVEINTDTWQVPFFCITVGAMTVISCSMSFGTTGNMVAISQFPDQYLKTYLIGEGVASLFTSAMRLISIAAAPTTIEAALFYFITGSFLMTSSSIMFYLSTHLAFFRYYTRNMKKSTRKRIPRYREFKDILRYIWPLLLLHVIGMIIPHASVGNLVVSEYYGTDSVWGNKYFITCTTYLLSAVCGILGRWVFYIFEINPSIKILYILSFGHQLIFTPLMFFVNAKPRNHLPVLFPHDWQYALIVGSSSFTGGYLGNIMTLKSIRLVPQDKVELSILVTTFIMKIISVATSPMGVLAVSLL